MAAKASLVYRSADQPKTKRTPDTHVNSTTSPGRGRIFLCSDENRLVTAQDIDKVVGRLEHERRFGDDNRAGFPGQLHRLSVMRRKQV